MKRTILLLLALSGAANAQSVAITHGTLIDGQGRTISEDGTVLIQDGKITAVGPSAKVKVPYDAKEISAKGKTVFPGMVLAETSQGLDRANESAPIGPFLDVRDSIDPSRLFFEQMLRDGVTTLHVIQGNDTVVAGLGRVLSPLGLTVGEMTVKGRSALKIAVAGKRGYDRVRQRAELREVFAELTDYVEGVAEKRYEEEEKKAKREVRVPPSEARELGMQHVRDSDLDDKHRNLWQLVQGRLDVFLAVPRAQDARFAIELATKNGFLARTTFVLGGDAFKAASLFAKAKRPVVLSQLRHTETDALTGEETETFVPSVLTEAKVPFALLQGAQESTRWLWYQAARCVRAGVPRAVALSAITRVPAAILGLEKRKGDLAVGLDGDVLILSGDPLEVTTQVESVVLGGALVYERAKDFRLRKLIGGEPPGPKAPEEKKAADKKDADKKADDKKADDKKADDKKDADKKDDDKKDDDKKDDDERDDDKKGAPR